MGNPFVRALSLKDGKELWKVKGGVPAGVGSFVNGKYLLPLLWNQPEIVILDVAQGRVVRRHSPGKEVPGNLFYHRGLVISQTATSVSGYRLELGK